MWCFLPLGVEAAAEGEGVGKAIGRIEDVSLCFMMFYTRKSGLDVVVERLSVGEGVKVVSLGEIKM
jgi:hypothetical protein